MAGGAAPTEILAAVLRGIGYMLFCVALGGILFAGALATALYALVQAALHMAAYIDAALLEELDALLSAQRAGWRRDLNFLGALLIPYWVLLLFVTGRSALR